MENSIELTDDEDEILFKHFEETMDDTIVVSSDDASTEIISSDDEELPNVRMALQEKKRELVKKLFPSNNKPKDNQPASCSSKLEEFKRIPPNNKPKDNQPASSSSKLEEFKRIPPPTMPFAPEKQRDPGINRMIEGVNINLPVNPYGCQVALMSLLIKAIKGSKNCLLESPTGSGKTLALLCASLGWLSKEKKAKAELKAQEYFSCHPELDEVDQAMEYVTSPSKKPPGTPDKIFMKNSFGSPENGQVRIHRKRKLDAMDCEEPTQSTSNSKLSTPEKKINQPDPDSPKLHVPTIYYGARTHKQLQQVIKEFGRTSYSDSLKMTILSSREHSCIREFDKQMWGTKDEMCKGCVRKIIPKDDTHRSREETNCKYYDNRQALKPERLPSAFDLEDLVKVGHELSACPYYAARELASQADIVFCPYNYLIDPSIRASMRIDLTDNILIVDEAHNIEDICRDAATYIFTRDNTLGALKELEIVGQYRYESSIEGIQSDIERLIVVMKNWDDWFRNQSRLLESAPVMNGEAVHSWEAPHFLKSLDYHNIGEKHYFEFQESAMKFCNQLTTDPRTLFGVTQSTGTLVESIATALGYFYRDGGKYKDDFKPVLVKIITGDTNGVSSWRSSQFEKMTESQALSLRLFCMNPAVVFSSLKVSRSIVLASGTLTPLISLHSELDTEFPLKISPSHVIPRDRVWIGTLGTHRSGRTLECKSRDTDQVDTQDSLGDAVLWVCSVTPHGVLCFLPSYNMMNKLISRWQDTGVWGKIHQRKNVFQENKNAKNHSKIMEDYYSEVSSERGALLLAVYRGKVSEGMDFKDHQARAVITIGIPYPNTFDMAVKAKMEYNDKYSRERNLLNGRQWLKVQAYRALNQAVGRCVRHKGDWGAVLLIDGRFQHPQYTEHLSKWVVNFLDGKHLTFQSLIQNADSLQPFMQAMTISENEDY